MLREQHTKWIYSGVQGGTWAIFEVVINNEWYFSQKKTTPEIPILEVKSQIKFHYVWNHYTKRNNALPRLRGFFYNEPAKWATAVAKSLRIFYPD